MFFICLEAISWMPGKVEVWLITDFLAAAEGIEESEMGARRLYDCLESYRGSAVSWLALVAGIDGLGDLVREGMIMLPAVSIRELPEPKLISCWWSIIDGRRLTASVESYWLEMETSFAAESFCSSSLIVLSIDSLFAAPAWLGLAFPAKTLLLKKFELKLILDVTTELF